MRVIAISGWKKSGKDTAAEHLISEFGFIRAAFADSLKDLCAEEYDVPRYYFDDQNLKEKPLLNLPVAPKDDFTLTVANFMYKEFRDEKGRIADKVFIDDFGDFMGVVGRDPIKLYHTPRSLAIFKGSGNRLVNPNYWTDKTIKNIKISNNSKFIISDLRYKNELEQLKLAFGDNLTTVRINRFDINPSTDPSETDLDSSVFDVTIDNTSTLEDFYNNINNLLT